MTTRVAAPRARKSFSRLKHVLDLPNLIDIQKASFQWFLDEGLRETIEELTRDLTKGPPLSRVENLDVTWRPPTGKFTAFAVRYAEFDS